MIDDTQRRYAIVKGDTHIGNMIISADQARRGDLFSCIECHEKLMLKKGDVRIAHFAHYPSEHDCNSESWYHKTAKFLIWQNANRHKLHIIVNCPVCGAGEEKVARHYESATTEYQIGEFKADVALFTGRKLKGVIEVFYSHESTDEKLAYFTDCKLPWIEVSATDVIENPYLMKPLRSSITFTICQKCYGIWKKVDELEKR